MQLANIGQAEVENSLQCSTFGNADEVPVSLLCWVVEVGIGGTHIEVPHHEELVRFVEFEGEFCPEQLEPSELELPRARTNPPAIGGIDRGNLLPLHVGRDEARFVEGRAMVAAEPIRDAIESDVAEQGHPSVAPTPEVHRFISETSKRRVWKLCIGASSFLQREHLGLLLLDEALNEMQSATNRVDIPRSEPHVPTIGPMTAGEPTDRPEITKVLESIRDLAEPLERMAILERVGRVAAESLDSDLGFVGLLDGPDHIRLSGVHGGRTAALETLRVERGRGLGGKVLALGSAASVEEYVAADSITHEYDAEIEREGLCGVLCLPLVVSGEIAGVAYVSDRTPRAYSDAMIDRVMSAVEAAQVALALADRSRRLTEAAVQAELERTARALDSSVGEHLGEIMQIAHSIIGDRNSSPELLAQATAIISSGAQASSALRSSTASQRPVPKQSVAACLSPRELQVVRLASRGLSNPEIADELFLARGTVKAYMESALHKLEARNRVEAVMIAARSGLLDDA